MRQLTEYELDLVAGGNTSSDFYDGGDGSPYQNGSPGYGGGGGGGASGTGWWQWIAVAVQVSANGEPPHSGWNGYWSWVPYESTGGVPPSGNGGASGAPQGPGGVELDNSTCPIELGAARSALELLYNNSATARALIDQANLLGTDGLHINIITASLLGNGPQDVFDHAHTIYWDPFQYVTGTNTNGTSYEISPIMLLAHELVHAGHAGDPAYQDEASEALVMSIANQIAAEMNAATGSHYDTTRDSHIRDQNGLHYTSLVTSTVLSIARPGCH